MFDAEREGIEARADTLNDGDCATGDCLACHCCVQCAEDLGVAVCALHYGDD
jgi:hypothetical protein